MDYRLTRQTAGNLFRQQYGYDSLGNMTLSNDETASLARQTYTYDAVGELTALSHANSLQNQNYQYDAVGNRTQQSSPGGGTADYRYDPDSQQLLGTVIGSPATGQQLNHFRSDARGAIDRSQAEFKSSIRNVFGRPVDYLYAPDQRLVQINRGGSPLASYAYDAFGHRIGKTWLGRPLHTFAYAGSQLLAENAGTPSHYAYLDGQPLARIDGSAANSPIYYFHNHPLGVPLKASNAAGQTVWAAQIQPFGLMQTTTAAISQNLRFPGQYFDAESGLHYNMARYYSPELGRYLQSDPIGLAGGINTYTYVGNNPLRYTDPLGLRPYVDTYTSPDAAAVVALLENNAQSIAQNTEYSGAVYQLPGENLYRYTESVPGSQDGSPLLPPNMPNDASYIESFHTHGADLPGWTINGINYNNIFSPDDIAIANAINKPNVMINPAWNIQKYDPKNPKTGRKGKNVPFCKK